MELDPKALAAARKRVERMIHEKGYFGYQLTISKGMHAQGLVNATGVAEEIVKAYLSHLPDYEFSDNDIFELTGVK